MGLFKKIASAMGRFRGNMRILVVGLDNSGKSTLIEHIKPNKVKHARHQVDTLRYVLVHKIKQTRHAPYKGANGHGRCWTHHPLKHTAVALRNPFFSTVRVHGHVHNVHQPLRELHFLLVPDT